MDATTPISSASHFIPADDDDEFDEDAIPAMSYPGGGVPVTPVSASSGGKTPISANTKGKARAAPPPPGGPGLSTNAGANATNGALSGNIGSSSGSNNTGANSNRRWIGNVQVETRYTGLDTLDEPVTATIGRDLLSIYAKLVQVLYPRGANDSAPALRDWDLWGPLVLCLGLAVMLSINAPPDQSLPTFSSVVVLISVGSVVVTLQTQLLGGHVSFFQALCVLGYCIAPLDIAALISCFVQLIYVRVPVCLLCLAWCVWASMKFFEGTKVAANRVLLAVYPLFLFYFILAWMILIQ
ncbi:hypothetical protein FRC20_006847 [Serendipita sp. 405]|nr:hypothetical protein FRC20_006847 [Serendipita sp. 405]